MMETIFLDTFWLSAHRDEVPSAAVHVHIVILHGDDFVGLRHEESGAAELRTLRGEGELTLHRHHVQASWETATCQTPAHRENSADKMPFGFPLTGTAQLYASLFISVFK